jgi:hypothetical protein
MVWPTEISSILALYADTPSLAEVVSDNEGLEGWETRGPASLANPGYLEGAEGSSAALLGGGKAMDGVPIPCGNDAMWEVLSRIQLHCVALAICFGVRRFESCVSPRPL